MKRKDLLGICGMSADEIFEILNIARELKPLIDAPNKKAPHLTGKSIITLFYENSTRTRMSFELATKYLGGVAANIAASSSSVSKGETLIDTGKTLDMMGTDVIVMRHPHSGAPHMLSKHVNASVINAGDGTNEHPTQALLDMFTIREKFGDNFRGMKVAIIGDVMHSRVARSNVWGLNTLNANVTVCAPPTLMPLGIEGVGVKIATDVRSAVKDADVVMCLRIQLERQKSGLFPSLSEYARFFGVNADVLKLANKDALVMHPGPMNRGVEIASDVADCPQSVILEQVKNGVAVRMAILYLLSRKATA